MIYVYLTIIGALIGFGVVFLADLYPLDGWFWLPIAFAIFTPLSLAWNEMLARWARRPW